MARVVLVTGSTDGLGRQIARQLAAAGIHVLVHGIPPKYWGTDGKVHGS